ncbi:MAG: HAMP domain-containing histidine kinase [Treponema sp.]|jgi:two-component system sensor histidine kinase VanS|nr:HAMP domain-containing histidine kinase [Treponema sp.]
MNGPNSQAMPVLSRRQGVFVKVFSYTLIFLVLVIAVTAVIFARQFLSFYRSDQTRQLSKAFQPLIDSFEGKGPEEIARIAGDFHERNQSFSFTIEDSEGRPLYSTGSEPGAAPPSEGAGLRVIFRLARGNTDYTLRGTFSIPAPVNYGALAGKILLALALMLVFCTLGAVFFARWITRPIMELAAGARRMAKLEEVPAPAWRNDEIGQLAQDIYQMYGALKETIASLEREVKRERTMEENQRAFFSAASHELKTPIAALRALTEGMLSNIGEYRDHRKYLRQCLDLLAAQNRLVSEVLEIASLAGEPCFETVNPAELTAAVIAEYAPIAAQRRQRVLSTVSAAALRADRRLLGRAFSNVLSNALRNSPEGAAIRVWDERPGPALLRLCVFNPGARLAGDEIPRLFEPFYRREAARMGGSGGLGLTIVKRALEGMHIPYALENAEDGVLFWMDLGLAEGSTVQGGRTGDPDREKQSG